MDDPALRRLEADAGLGRTPREQQARVAELEALAAHAVVHEERGRALMLLGATHQPTHPGPAAAAYREAAGAFWRAKDRGGESEALMRAAACVGGEEGTTLARRALRMRREDGDRRGEAELLVQFGEAALAGDDPAGAVARLREAEALLEGLGSPAALDALRFHLTRALLVAGIAEERGKRLAAADARYAEGEATARLLDDGPGILARALDLRGALALHQGRIGDAVGFFRGSLASHRAARQMPGEAAALVQLAHAELHRGDPGEAVDALRLARHLLVHLRSGAGHPDVAAGFGRAALEEGALRRAAKSFRQALDAAPEHEVALLHAAEVAARRGRHEEADALLARAEPVASAGNLLQIRGELAAQRGDEAAARAAWAAAVTTYAEAGDALGEADTLRREAELLRRRRDPEAAAVAEAAARLYVRLGCDPIAARLRRGA